MAYLSVLVSFLGGRAHGSDLAAPLRWGRGKCTVILKERNQKWERSEGKPARISAASLSLCPQSQDSWLVPLSVVPRPGPQYLLSPRSPLTSLLWDG